ncbi:MAG: 3-hydroxyacyl-ACP dehydratase [Vicingaceae bacterium]|nr:3-hydroxyacyl-ACP dehydratase [Vicingaceae bacterium]
MILLKNDFFEIEKLAHSTGLIVSTIKINSLHTIFDGHFPNNPITPGVVQLQITKEVLEDVFQQELQLKEMKNCKFLAILNPTETPIFDLEINYETIDDVAFQVSAKGTTANESKTFFKFTAKYEMNHE